MVPDWICEVLPPATVKRDRVVKMPVYARFGVGWLWLVDPVARTLEAFALEDGKWVVIAQHKDDEVVAVAPFDAIHLELGALWAEAAPEEGEGG